MKLFFKSFLLCLSIMSVNCYAWNALAHMVIANIAYERLKPEVRFKVDRMITDLAKEYPNITNFSQMASWPDEVRAQQKIGMFNHWHYIDIPFSQDSTPIKKHIDPDNIVWAINQIEPIVKNPDTNPFERARFLAFLTHFVGDIHQPLHTAMRYSKEHPAGDLGGNLFLILYPANQPQPIPLHRFWDSGLGLFDIEASFNNVAALSSLIISHYPEEYFSTKINDFSIKNWSNEGFITANIFVYNTPENQVPSSTYIEKGRHIVEEKVALSGYRLASLLNILLR